MKYSIQTCMSDNLSELNEEQFVDFLTKIKNICISPCARMIYRGDTNTNLRKQYKITSEETSIFELAKYLFLIGEKGKHFWDGETLPFEILGDDLLVIEHIWDKVSSLLKEMKIEESLFSEEGKELFMQKMESIDENQKRMILDYYYSYVHTYNSKSSHYLSTSENLSIALKFLHNKSGIIIVGWVPDNLCNEMMISYEDVCLYRSNIESLEFPVFKTLYPEQQEVCLKCGILPHFMIGFYVPKKRTFVVNPALFRTTSNMEKIIINGFDVDQSEFLEVLKKTGYSKCYWYDKGVYKAIQK